MRLLLLAGVLSVAMLLASCTSTTTTTTSANSQTPTSQAPDVKKAAEYNTQLGIGYLKQGNYERAKQKLLTALQQDPNSPQANAAMAYFLEKTGEPARAEDYYKTAVSLAKDPGATENNYGAFLCRQKRYQDAEVQFVKATQDPNYINPANAFENAGLCALLMPDTNLAIQYFQQALQKNPNMGTSMLQLSEIYYKNQDYAKSYQYVQQFLKSNSPTAEALWLAIRLAYQRSDSNSATSYGILLQSKFADSRQYQAYLKLKATKE